jgi:hypothetical protein
MAALRMPPVTSNLRFGSWPSSVGVERVRSRITQITSKPAKRSAIVALFAG